MPLASTGLAEPGNDSESSSRDPSFGGTSERTNTPSAPMRLVVVCMESPPPENLTGTTSLMVCGAMNGASGEHGFTQPHRFGTDTALGAHPTGTRGGRLSHPPAAAARSCRPRG